MLDDYLVKLCNDIKECFSVIKSLGITVSTVYVGGGTPTTLNEAQLKIDYKGGVENMFYDNPKNSRTVIIRITSMPTGK